MSNYKDIMDFIGERVEYDNHIGVIIWGTGDKDYLKVLAKPECAKELPKEELDRLGQFIAEAINEKMQRERNPPSND